MKSMNNWLTFSLQSAPHLAIDAVKQHAESVSHQARSSANNFILSSMSQNHGNNLGGYQTSANDCYNSLRSGGDGGTSSSSQGLEMMQRSDGSFCIMEALSRSHSAEHWPQQQQRGMQSDGGVPPHTLLTADQLSRLTGNASAGDLEQQMAASHSHYDMPPATATGETHDGPKLEDFLGGASLGGQYSDSRDQHQQPHHQHQQQQLDSLYYPVNYARDIDSQSRCINVNLPYSSQAGAASGSLHDVPPSFQVAYGGPDQSSLSSFDHQHESNLLAGNRMHAQNLLQAAALEQSASEPAGTEDYGHELKTWLRHQAAAEKAGQRGLNGLASLQPLTLSMSAGSHQSSVSPQIAVGESATATPEPRKRGAGRAGSKEPSPRKSIDTFGQRTSVYRGVTRHRWTGRYEAHLWDNSCRKEGQTRKGRQVYLGGYDKEEKAARAYDLAALKYWGPSTTINFPLTTYETELEEMKNMTRQEYVASLRRKSSGFSRGASMYRGVTRHHQHGRWQARIGRVAGNKDLYLGTYSTQEEAAEAYDIAAIKFRGLNAVTNFDISRYDAARIQQAAVNGHHGPEAMKAAKEVELAAGLNTTPLQCRAAAQAATAQLHTSQVEEDVHSAGTPGSQLTSEGGLSKNLHEWQMLYQQQAAQQQQPPRTSWGCITPQDQDRSAQRSNLLQGFSGESMRAPTSKFPPPTNGMLLRNLMGLEALPQDHHSQGMATSGSLISTSGYQGSSDHMGLNSPPMSNAAYQQQQQQQHQHQHQHQHQQQGSVDRGAVVDSPKNSVGESEEASSKSSAYDPVLQGELSRNGILYLSPGSSSQGKMGGYVESNALSPWISQSPTTVQSLAGRSNLSIGGHMGSGPIFAHSWSE